MNLIWLAPFVVSSFLLFSLPGIVLLTKSQLALSFWQKLFLGTVIGFVLFTLTSYFFLTVKLAYLVIPAFAVADLYFFRSLKLRLPKIQIHSSNMLFILVFLAGIVGQLAVIAPSGRYVNGDLLFWSSHGHDASWHIALSNEIQRGFPLQNPEFAGEKLVNYHIFSDVAPAMFNKYLKMPQVELYFRLFPLLYSLLLGASVYFLGKEIGKSRSVGLWSVFFAYFAGSFGYVVTLIQGRGIGGESLFWGSQIQSSIGNPPFIAANIIFVTFLYFFLHQLKNPNKILYLISILLLGSLAVFKIYGAIVLFGALAVAGVWQVIRERKFGIISLLLPAGLLASGLFLPFYAKTSSFLIFEPWWHIRTMIVEPSRLNLLDWELRRQTYIYENNWKRVVYLEGLGFLIFFFGNLGMRFVGLLGFIKLAKTIFSNYFSLIFISATGIALIFPLLFLQRGVAGGTANFLQYFILLFGFTAALAIVQIGNLVGPIARYTLAIGIILLAIPTQVGLLKEFYSRPAFAKISKAELAALTFIKYNTTQDAVIITPPYDQYWNFGGSTPAIWDWFDTGYVAAFSDRRTYFDDYEQVDIMGYDFKGRDSLKRALFATPDTGKFKDLMGQSRAQILYYPKAVKPQVNPAAAGLTKIFENTEVEIWKI